VECALNGQTMTLAARLTDETSPARHKKMRPDGRSRLKTAAGAGEGGTAWICWRKS